MQRKEGLCLLATKLSPTYSGWQQPLKQNWERGGGLLGQGQQRESGGGRVGQGGGGQACASVCNVLVGRNARAQYVEVTTTAAIGSWLFSRKLDCGSYACCPYKLLLLLLLYGLLHCVCVRVQGCNTGGGQRSGGRTRGPRRSGDPHGTLRSLPFSLLS